METGIEIEVLSLTTVILLAVLLVSFLLIFAFIELGNPSEPKNNLGWIIKRNLLRKD